MAMIPFAGVSSRPARDWAGLGTWVLRPARAQREGVETQALAQRSAPPSARRSVASIERGRSLHCRPDCARDVGALDRRTAGAVVEEKGRPGATRDLLSRGTVGDLADGDGLVP